MGPTLAKKSLKNYVTKRLNSGNEECNQATEEFLFQISLQPEASTEVAIHVCFKVGHFPHNPLWAENRLGKQDFPLAVSFVFGRHDWVSDKGAKRLLEINKFKETGESQIHVVQKAGHNMQNDNPTDLAAIIIGDLTGSLTHQYEEKIEMYFQEGDETDLQVKDLPPLRPYD